MDHTPDTTTQRAAYIEARIKAQQQEAAVVDQKQQAVENTAAVTLLEQQQAAAMAVQQQQAPAAMLLPQQKAAALAARQQQAQAATLLPQQQAAALVSQQQAAVLTTQQKLAAAQAALAATIRTVPTGQPPTQNITFANTAGFALNPAMANQGILDYNTTEGRKVYDMATRAISKVGYECDPNGLYQDLDILL